MKPYRIYIWAAVYLILANVWLYHFYSTWGVLYIFPSDRPPEWETLLTVIVGISLLPTVIIAEIMLEFSRISGVAAIFINSAISILIYIPLIHLAKQWILTKHQSPSGMLGSIRQRAHDFSASLNPRGPIR